MNHLSAELDPLSDFLFDCKWGYLVFHRKRLQPRLLPWQQHRSHSVSFVMYVSGAKFEEHCSNISGDILD